MLSFTSCYQNARSKLNFKISRVCENICGCPCGGSGSGSGGVLTLENMNQNVVKLEYAVRGPIVARSAAIQEEINKGAQKPFSRVIGANIGDGHAMGQKPITFIRQVLSCCVYPPMLGNPQIPGDVKKRAQTLLNACGGKSSGAYTHSLGIPLVRKDVARYISERDGVPANLDDVLLCAGASTGIKAVMNLFIKTEGKPPGVMIPIPQYPMYSATIVEFGMKAVPYYLDEDKNWGISMQEMQKALEEGQQQSDVKILVVINPGNPTGQVLKKEDIVDLIKFANDNKLYLFADEVYQHNVYGQGCKFHSFKKVLKEMGDPYSNKQELASFMSLSKGYMGECGFRSGWCELVNMHPEVKAHFHKALSAMLCPSALGQIAMDCVANPPKQGEESYAMWRTEREQVLGSLKMRAQMISATFNKMEGFKCNEVQGAMYAFPQITLPPKAIEAAKKDKKAPDLYYCFQLLEETGICIIPGSGFGQKPGTYHFRTTILPQPELLKQMLNIFSDFHKKFTKKYA